MHYSVRVVPLPVAYLVARAAAGLTTRKLHAVLEVGPSFPLESFGYRHRRRRAQRDELTNSLERNLVDVPRNAHTATTPTPGNRC